MQPMQPGGIPPTRQVPSSQPPPGHGFAPPAQAPQKKSGGGVGLLLLLGGLGCFGLVAVVGAAGLAFFLVRSSDASEATPYGEAYGGDAYGGYAGDPLAAPTPLPAAPLDPSEPERFRVPITAADPSRGPSDALVTIVEFGDFQCPFCARASQTLRELEGSYPGQVRIVWKHNPLAFHTDAMPAALVAMEARAQRGDPAFWQMHDRLFRDTRALSRGDLERYASEQGLDVARVRTAIDLRTHAASITAGQELAQQLGATGTPTFFINGRLLTGAQPITAFREIVDDELVRARQLEAAGTPRAAIYDTLTRNGRTSPAPREPVGGLGAAEPEDADRIHRVPVGDSPQRGPEDALVTIVAFSDFQCPFCARVTDTLDRIEAQYGRDVRIVFKHNPLPFHTDAMPAAQAAVEVQRERGDRAFWQMHDLLFENQRQLSTDDLVRHARRAGASGSGVRRALQRDAHRATVQADMDLAAQVGARGTPTFFINGKKLAGAQPYERFRDIVDRELATARALLAAGTPRSRIYDTVMERAD